jgi:hypothetical protein
LPINGTSTAAITVTPFVLHHTVDSQERSNYDRGFDRRLILFDRIP